jgi:hypothetical protein
VPGQDQATEMNSHGHLRRPPLPLPRWQVKARLARGCRIRACRSGQRPQEGRSRTAGTFLEPGTLRILVGLPEFQLIATFTELEL